MFLVFCLVKKFTSSKIEHKKSIEIKANKWVTRLSVFFGVMLMPVGIAIFILSNLSILKK